MNILILGSSGLLGSSIYHSLRKISYLNVNHNGLKKRKYDLTKITDLKNLLKSKQFHLIINCAAYTNIDYIEKHKLVTNKINIEMLKNIFLIKKKYNLKFNLIHFSTDQMYNFKNIYHNEKSKIKILNHYTAQKINSEKICLKNKSLIFRTNFFGKKIGQSDSLTDWLFKSFTKKNEKFFLFDDIFFNPLYVKTLANIICKIINNKKYSISGIFNLGSKNGISKKDFAHIFAKKLNIYDEKKFIITTSKTFFKVKRTRFMMMNVSKFEKFFSIKTKLLTNEIYKSAKEYLN